jgi:hypothetical protein
MCLTSHIIVKGVDFLFDKEGPKQSIKTAMAGYKQLDLSNFDPASVSLYLFARVGVVYDVLLLLLVVSIFTDIPCIEQQSVAEKVTSGCVTVDTSDAIKRVREEYQSKSKVCDQIRKFF